MIKFFCFITICFATLYSAAQSYAPAAGQSGSTAIHYDSLIIIGWATTCDINRGYKNVEDTTLGLASFGTNTDALGPVNGINTNVVALGDGGIATLSFEYPIKNGIGPDFAVFENGVNDDFLEIAFVEVSSDGIHFVRFSAISEVQTTTQIGGFGQIDCRELYNFAGKYRSGFGTPFDLEELIDSTSIDVNKITHVRIVDVIGSINPAFATFDSQGTIVNNLHPTPFESGGFDLDGIAVMHIDISASITNKKQTALSVFPNPSSDKIQLTINQTMNYQIIDLLGQVQLHGEVGGFHQKITISKLPRGSYFIQLENGNTARFIKN